MSSGVKKSAGGGKSSFGICFAPFEFSDQEVAKSWGGWAEGFVMLNYLKKTDAKPSVTDWFDIRVSVPGVPARSWTLFDNPVAYFNFLARHHPHLEPLRGAWSKEFFAGKTAVPDIHTVKPGRFEYYEIKPGSDSGERAGTAKLGKLSALFADVRFGMQVHKAGTTYTPGKADDVDITDRLPRTLMARAMKLGVTKVKVVLRFRRAADKPGLVMYWICIDLEADSDMEEEAVESIARWYAVHTIRTMKANAALTDAQVTPQLEVQFTKPGYRQLIPGMEELQCALLTAGPAAEYVIVGPQAAVEFADAAAKAEMEAIKAKHERDVKNLGSLYNPGMPGWYQLYRHPSEVNRSTYNYQAAVAVAQTATIIIIAVMVVSVVAVVAAAAVLGTAAATVSVVAPSTVAGAGTTAGTAGAGTSLIVAVAAPPAVVESVGGMVTVEMLAQQAAAQMARSSLAKGVALGAGVFAVIGVSNDAFAGPGKARPAATFGSVKGLRVVPKQNALREGEFVLGSVRLVDASAAQTELEPHKPMD